MSDFEDDYESGRGLPRRPAGVPPLPPLTRRPAGVPPVSIPHAMPEDDFPPDDDGASHLPPPPPPVSHVDYEETPTYSEEEPDGPRYEAPRDLEWRPRGPRERGPMAWIVMGLIVLLIGVGVVGYFATREGPDAAAANDLTDPETTPADDGTGKRNTVKVTQRALSSGNLGTVQSLGTGRKRPGPLNVAVVNSVTLPHPRELDRLTEQMERLAEAKGLVTKPIKPLKSIDDGPSIVQPVELKLEGTFPQLITFLQAIRTRFPAALLDVCDVTPIRSQSPDATPRLRTWMIVNFHLQKEDKRAGEVLMPTVLPDLIGSLVDVARLTQGTFAMLSLSVTVDGAADAPGKPLKPVVRAEALGESDAKIEELVQSLNQGENGMFGNVSLIVTDTTQVGTHPARKFAFKFNVPDQRREVPGAEAALNASGVPDPFVAPGWLRRAASPAPAPARPRSRT